ncbi:MAG: type IV pilus modification protein PilV [Parahaliea sp.]
MDQNIKRMCRSVSLSRRSQEGFTLIEVLVAVLILSVGVLGVAAMQVMSVEANRGAFYRSQALHIGAEILDAIRANPSARTNYVVGINKDSSTGMAAISDPGCAASAMGCSAEDMAKVDLREWANHFINVDGMSDYRPTLPGGNAQIQMDGDLFTVTVGWRQRVFDDDDSDGGKARSVSGQTIQLISEISP